MPDVVRGADELAKYLNRMPQRAARALQREMIFAHLEHKKQTIAGARVDAGAKRRLKFAMQVRPRSTKAAPAVKCIEEVNVETFSFWRGQAVEDPKLGAAARIETTIGPTRITPTKGRYLFIPLGPLLTPTGRPRRIRQGRILKPVSPADDLSQIRGVPRGEVFFQRRKGKLLVRYRRARRRTGQPDVMTIGTLVRSAESPNVLPFFSTWRKLSASRDRRYRRVLERTLADD